MAHGSPDWHRLSDVDILAQSVGDIHINVSGQDLAQIINRPTYGQGIRNDFGKTVAAGTTETLFTINGTGIVYGGHLSCVSTISKVSDRFKFIVDGETVNDYTWSKMLDRRIIQPGNCDFNLTKYDQTAFYYVCLFPKDMTFESGLTMTYTAISGASSIVVGDVIYATI